MFNPTTNVGNYDVMSTRHNVQSSAIPPNGVHNQQNVQACYAAYQNQHQVGSTVPNQNAVRRTQNQTAGYHNQQQPKVTQNCGYNSTAHQSQTQGQQMQQQHYNPHSSKFIITRQFL